MLATKISFINEMANVCERMALDVENVRLGIRSDARIRYSFHLSRLRLWRLVLCQGRQALIHMAQQHDFEPSILNAVETRNHRQKSVLFDKITARVGRNLEGHSVGLWRLACKPGTNDMREAPSIMLLTKLIEAGGTVMPMTRWQ